jgi:hypothetical protein
MLQLPSGYEILQACAQPIKIEDEPFSIPWKKLEVWLFQWILSLFLRKGKKNSANFEHYDLKDDNELDPNIWWGSSHTN